MSVTLVLADDQPIILYGLEQLFAREQDFHVLGSCATGGETLEAVRGHRPAVLVLGLRLAVKDGLTVLRELRAEGLPTRVVVFSSALKDELVVEAIHLGARGVVLKEMAPKLLVQCIRKVHAGGEWFETRSVSHILGEIRQRNTKTHRGGELTAREREIVSTVAWGLRNHEIAERLSIGVGTVKVHLHNIYAKLEVTNRIALFLRARERV
ncbi:MAG: response regulator transcription factor [Pseudomonadota bacterium]|nr:response regulator transcription factor [Gammaproteobacteria bacterium]MDQ3580803.1 response regulator transcription factor [Pseudomonadota bacterium]